MRRATDRSLDRAVSRTRRHVLGDVLGLGLGLGAGLVAGASLARTQAAGMLRTHGRDLMLDGVAVLLRGVSVGDAILARRGRSVADYATLARDWGASLVRISVHPGLWRADPGAMDQALEREVGAALAQGLAVIVAWHAIGWPDGPHEVPDPTWGMPPDAYSTDLELAHRFWAATAARLGGAGKVMFEIWNEPTRLDPPGFSPWGEDWRALRPVWRSLIATIRGKAANVILATGGAWAADLTGIREDPLPEPDIGYAWHVYPGTAGGDPARLEALLDRLPQVRPVVVSEWGFSPAPDQAGGHLAGTRDGFGAMFTTRFLARYGLSWTAWCWHPDWQPPLIQPDWTTPTEAGALVRTLLGK